MNIKHPTARMVLGLAAILPGLAPAAAPQHEPAQRYVSAHLGVNKLSNWPGRVDFGGPQVDARLELDRGAHLGAALGRQRGAARYEVEYQHGRVDIERAAVAALSQAADGSGHYDVLTANALRDLLVRPGVTLYGGVGLGLARVQLPHIDLANGCRCLGEADETGFAWQARIGAEHRVGQAGRVFGQLGYLRLPGPESSSVSYRSKGVGVLSVGYRHLF